MAKVFYSLAGEGRGHATRVQTIVEELRSQHKITLFAPKDAYDLLEPYYRNTEVSVIRIPGLSFYYSKDKRLDYIKSFWEAMKYLAKLPSLVKWLKNKITQEKPDLVITDFDPALPRAARKAKVPYISFDHQNFLRTYDLSSLPWHLRWRAHFMGFFVQFFYWGQMVSIVSSFYFPPLKKSARHVKQIGVLLRREILKAAKIRSKKTPFLIAYLRRNISDEVLEILENSPLPVKLYGLGERPSQGNLQFHAVDGEKFIQDLASSRALITTAGNQVVGEALYLKKPVLAMPEPGNFEQQINGHFLAQQKAGISCEAEDFSLEILEDFLQKIPELKKNIKNTKVVGNQRAINIINKQIKRAVHWQKNIHGSFTGRRQRALNAFSIFLKDYL